MAYDPPLTELEKELLASMAQICDNPDLIRDITELAVQFAQDEDPEKHLMGSLALVAFILQSQSSPTPPMSMN